MLGYIPVFLTSQGRATRTDLFLTTIYQKLLHSCSIREVLKQFIRGDIALCRGED
jgi:hypothetical protein